MKNLLLIYILIFSQEGRAEPKSPCYWAGTVAKCMPVAGITHIAPASTASTLTLDSTASTNQNAQVIFKGNWTGPTAQTWNAGLGVSLTSGAFEVYDATLGSTKFSVLPGTTGGVTLKGTAVNGDPTAGWIGEYKEAKTTTATNCAATATYFDAQSLVLTAGDWDCQGTVMYLKNGSTYSAMDFAAGISTTTGNSATGLTAPVTYVDQDFGATALSNNNLVASTPIVRVQSDGTNLYINAVTSSTTQTIYLKGFINAYTGGPPQYKSFLRCRRPR